MSRPLYEIAREIRATWVDKNGKPNVWFGAEPYVDAMESLDAMTDNYGLDSAKYIVIYFLGNANTWRGEDARRIKAELKAMAGVK